MSRLFGQITNWTATDIVGTAATTAKILTAPITQGGNGAWRFLAVLVKMNGTVTNATIDLSVEIIDENGVAAWLPKQTVNQRTLWDGSKAVEIASFDIHRASPFRIALESNIVGGGTVELLYAYHAE